MAVQSPLNGHVKRHIYLCDTAVQKSYILVIECSSSCSVIEILVQIEMNSFELPRSMRALGKTVLVAFMYTKITVQNISRPKDSALSKRLCHRYETTMF